MTNQTKRTATAKVKRDKAAGGVCQAMGRNEICYGNNEVEATFVDPAAINFTQPSDIAPVPLLNSLRTSAFDETTGRFGVAVMQVQASNIPNTLPGQVVTFLLIGDVSLQNTVTPEEAFTPVEPIEVFTLTVANIRVEPNSNSSIAWSVAANSSLAIDARNEAGDWFRVVGTEQTAWVSTTVLVQNDGMNGLPVYDRASRTAMQAFYFQAGIGRTSCEQAPNQLIIQGPQGLVTNLTINGAEVRIGSTVALSQPAEGVVRISVLDGHALVNQISVPSGFSIDAYSREHLIAPNAWGNFHPLAPQELEFHHKTSSSLSQEIVTYIPDVPTVQDVQFIETAIAPQPTATPTEIATETPLPNVVSSGGSSDSSNPACYDNGTGISFTYRGNANAWGNRNMFSNETCSGTSFREYNHGVIIANDLTQADSICSGMGGSLVVNYNAYGWNTPSNWYECQT